MDFFKKQYAKSFAFLREKVLRVFLVCVLVFLALSVAAYYVLLQYPDTAVTVYQEFSQMVDSSDILDDSGNIRAMGLFFHNAQSAGISAIYGMVPFVFLPVLSLVMNGAVIGGVLAVLRIGSAVSIVRTVVFGLLPHGIFELPAILLAMAMGIYLCKNITGLILKKPWADRFEVSLEHMARVYCTVILPLLFVAGLIEAYVTPVLMQMYV